MGPGSPILDIESKGDKILETCNHQRTLNVCVHFYMCTSVYNSRREQIQHTHVYNFFRKVVEGGGARHIPSQFTSIKAFPENVLSLKSLLSCYV